MECLVAREPEQCRVALVSDQSCSMMGSAVDHQGIASVVALSESGHGQQFSGETSPSELVGLNFSKELIAFSLFGKIHPKCKRPWNESLSVKIAEVQESFKNIPPKLYFSPSSVQFDGIGVYAAEPLPQETMLGPYYGRRVNQISSDLHNEWLWEVYHSDSSLAHFIDASDPKLGNWMNFIQCARSSREQNLKMVQFDTNIYYIVTRNIAIGDELLVWYDQQQYDVYMGVPTGFRPAKDQPLAAQKFPQTGMPHTSNNPRQLAMDKKHIKTRNNAETSTTQQHYTSVAPNTTAAGVTTSSQFLDSTSTDDSGFCCSLEHSDGSIATSLSGSFECSNSQMVTDVGKSVPQLSETQAHQQQPTSHSSSVENVTIGYHSTGHQLTDSEYKSPRKWSGTQAASSGVYVSPVSGHLHTPEHGAVSSSWVQGHSTSSAPGEQSPASKKQLLYGMFSRSDDGTRWQCEECKRLFSSQGSLRAHARIHTGERPYQCQYCYRTFCQASTLRSHERLHTGEKPYKCEHCGRAFTQSAGLRSHLKTHRYDS